ncbi:MAG: hypothetical protein ACK526_22285 [Planctomyces sp.]|jgi:hypothetical protein
MTLQRKNVKKAVARGSLYARIRYPRWSVRVVLVSLVYGVIGGLTGALLAVFISLPGLLVSMGSISGGTFGIWLEGISDMADRSCCRKCAEDRFDDD